MIFLCEDVRCAFVCCLCLRVFLCLGVCGLVAIRRARLHALADVLCACLCVLLYFLKMCVSFGCGSFCVF